MHTVDRRYGNNSNNMYDIDIVIKGEAGATVDQFVAEVTEVLARLNASWATLKAGIPLDQQPAAENKVRAILKA